MRSSGEHTFGPSALLTPANALTLARLLATPIFVLLIIVRGASWVSVIVGFAVVGSDGVDGWIARRQGTTRSGAFLDPLADKAVVLGAFFTLAGEGRLPWIPIILIAIREVGMSIYRSWVGRRGVSIPARKSAKIKTVIQDVSIALCLVPPLANQHQLQIFGVWVAAVLTLATGIEYLLDGRRAFEGAQR